MDHPYEGLDPDTILDAMESAGFVPDGHLLSLNSYENRVLQVGIDQAQPLVAKFYRPDRWSDAAIDEEHGFSQALQSAEIPVVAPLADEHGQTLHRHAGFRFALFPRQGGRAPDLEDPDKLAWIGRLIGRIHQLGAQQPFQQRPSLTPQTFGHDAVRTLLASGRLPDELHSRYLSLVEPLIDAIKQAFAAAPPAEIRLHGDCHPGNLLWTDSGPHFVDMDDCRMGPAVQDLWMLLSGERADMTWQMDAVLEGYRMFRSFDMRELALIEPLRGLRIIHYAAWLASRWGDPAFPQAFPWFGSYQYWEDHFATLQQQSVALQQPPLFIY